MMRRFFMPVCYPLRRPWTTIILLGPATPPATDARLRSFELLHRHDRPVPWVRVHDLPDYVYFNHDIHVNRGMPCVACHGRIDTMERVRQVEPLSMGWCLGCHRAPAGPDTTTLPAPAPPPAGLARTSRRPSTTALERLPANGELFFGLYHLLVLVAVILVLVAMAASAAAFSTRGRSGDDPVAGTSLVRGLVP